MGTALLAASSNRDAMAVVTLALGLNAKNPRAVATRTVLLRQFSQRRAGCELAGPS